MSPIVPLAAAVLAGFAGGVISQQIIRPAQAASTGVLVARDFRLVDANGKVLAELAPVKFPKRAPVAELVMYGASGHRADLQSEGLFFGRGYADEDLGVGYAATNNPAVFFWHKKAGRMGLMLDAKNGGAPSAFMYDATGKSIWSVP